MEKYNIPEPNSLGSMEGLEENMDKVKLVPVEELIPGIKPVTKISLESVTHVGNRFDDSFIESALQNEFKRFVKSFVDSVKFNFSDFKDAFDVIRERFRNKIVIDLGAGSYTWGYFLSIILGAKGYVAVEPHNSGELEENLQGYDDVFFRKQFDSVFPNLREEINNLNKEELKDLLSFMNIPASVVKDTMLNFLKRLPADSVCIFTFGIHSELNLDEKYLDETNKEILRVLENGGAYISDSNPRLSKGLIKLSSTTDDYTKVLFDVNKHVGFFIKQ